MCLIPTQQSSGHLYLNAMWLGVDLRMDTKKTRSKEIGPCAHNMLTILGSIVNMIEGTYMTT